MHICYLDDSGDADVRAFSLISVPVIEWHTCFQQVKAYRRWMKDKFGIYVMKELHATDFCGGRGKIAPHQIDKARRCTIYNHCLAQICRLQGISLFSSVRLKSHRLP